MEENIDKEGTVIVYRGTVVLTLWVHLFMLAFLIMCIYFFVALQVQGYPWPSLFFAGFAVFWVFVWINSRHLDFLITTDYVEFGFGIVKKRIKRSELVACEPYRVHFYTYLGYGVRIGWDKTIAFISRSGPAVKLVLKDNKWPYVVNVNDPERICELLSK
jgi:hypothetical protein